MKPTVGLPKTSLRVPKGGQMAGNAATSGQSEFGIRCSAMSRLRLAERVSDLPAIFLGH